MVIEQVIGWYALILVGYTILVSLSVREDRRRNRLANWTLTLISAPSRGIRVLLLRLPDHSRPFILTIVVAGLLIAMIASSLFDGNLLSYQQIVRTPIANPRDPAEGLYLFMELRSPTFAANMPIEADIFLQINQTYRLSKSLTNSDNLPNSFSIVFLDTYCAKEERFVVPGLCLTDLKKSSPIEFRGHKTIVYSHSGAFGVVLSNNDGKAGETRLEKGIIHVSPTEGANDFRTFKMSIVIGIIASAIGTLALLQRRHR